MIVFVALHVLLRPLNQVQLTARSQRVPSVPSVVEGLGNLLEAQNLVVEVGAGFQVVHVDGNVIKPNGIGSG